MDAVAVDVVMTGEQRDIVAIVLFVRSLDFVGDGDPPSSSMKACQPDFAGRTSSLGKMELKGKDRCAPVGIGTLPKGRVIVSTTICDLDCDGPVVAFELDGGVALVSMSIISESDVAECELGMAVGAAMFSIELPDSSEFVDEIKKEASLVRAGAEGAFVLCVWPDVKWLAVNALLSLQPKAHAVTALKTEAGSLSTNPWLEVGCLVMAHEASRSAARVEEGADNGASYSPMLAEVDVVTSSSDVRCIDFAQLCATGSSPEREAPRIAGTSVPSAEEALLV